jgi:acyl carrier protein
METLLEEADELLKERFVSRSFPVPLRTLSSIIAEKCISRIDLLKINAEKSEWEILQGIGEKDWEKIRKIVLEVDSDESLQAILELLERQGFEAVVEQDELLAGTPLRYVYAVRPVQVNRQMRKQELGVDRQPIASWSQSLSATTLREFLSQRLPEVMIPSAFVLLNELPLTPNGKVDRKSLPPPEVSAIESMKNYVAPQTPIEQMLERIWAEVLKLERVSIIDNFFEIGGHSLSATQVVSRIRNALSIDLPLRWLFEAPTIKRLSEVIVAASGRAAETVGNVLGVTRKSSSNPEAERARGDKV